MGLTQVNTSSYLGQSCHVGRNSNKFPRLSQTSFSGIVYFEEVTTLMSGTLGLLVSSDLCNLFDTSIVYLMA